MWTPWPTGREISDEHQPEEAKRSAMRPIAFESGGTKEAFAEGVQPDGATLRMRE